MCVHHGYRSLKFEKKQKKNPWREGILSQICVKRTHLNYHRKIAIHISLIENDQMQDLWAKNFPRNQAGMKMMAKTYTMSRQQS